MTRPNRRQFLKDAGLGLAAVTACHLGVRAASAHAPSEQVRVGLIGPGGMGSSHLNELVRRKDVVVTHVCDVDANRLATAAKLVKDQSGQEAQSHPGSAAHFGRSGGRCRVDCHARPLARPSHHPGLRRGKTCLRGKTLRSQYPRRTADGGGGAATNGSSRSARNRAAPSTSWRRCRPCATGSLAKSWWRKPGTANCGAASDISNRAIHHRILDFDMWLGPHPLNPINPTCCTASGGGGTRSAPEISGMTGSTTSTLRAGAWV